MTPVASFTTPATMPESAVRIQCTKAMHRSRRSAIPTGIDGGYKKSPSACQAESKAPHRSAPSTTLPPRCAALPTPTENTKVGSDKTTRTGQTGTPISWWPSTRAPSFPSDNPRRRAPRRKRPPLKRGLPKEEDDMFTADALDIHIDNGVLYATLNAP